MTETKHKKGQFSERWKLKTQNIDSMQVDKRISQIQLYRDNLEKLKKINILFNSAKEGMELNLSEDNLTFRCNNLMILQQESKELKTKTTYFETQVYPYIFPVFQEVLWKCLIEADLESPYLSDYQKMKAKKIYDDIPDV